MRHQGLARSNFCQPISVLFHQNKLGVDTTAARSLSIAVQAEEVSWHPRSSCSTFQSHSTAFLLWYTYTTMCDSSFMFSKLHSKSTQIKRIGVQEQFNYPSSRRISWASEERFLSSSQHFKVEDSSVSLLVVTKRFSSISGTTLERCPAFTKALLPDFASVM